MKERLIKISGLEVIDDSTMKIHLKEMTPSVYWGGNFVPEFVNAKQFEGIPMDKITEFRCFKKESFILWSLCYKRNSSRRKSNI